MTLPGFSVATTRGHCACGPFFELEDFLEEQTTKVTDYDKCYTNRRTFL